MILLVGGPNVLKSPLDACLPASLSQPANPDGPTPKIRRRTVYGGPDGFPVHLASECGLCSGLESACHAFEA